MDSTLAYAVAAAALSSYLLWFWLLARNLSGPTVWPVIGSLPGLFLNRSRIHDWISGHLRSSGPSATYQTSTLPLPFLPSGSGFYTVTAHPRNVEHILRTRFDNYPKGPIWQSAFHDLLGHGIFNADGPSWLVQRKTAALEFTTRTLRLAMARWVNRAIRSRLWVVLDKSIRDNRPVDIQDLLLRLTFDNICGLTLGRDPETLSPDLPDNPFSSAFDSATSATLDRLLYPRLLRLGSERRLRTTLCVVDRYMSEALASRSATTTFSDDLISRFARRTGPDGKPYPDETLKRIALNFVLAGRDTSSVALAWFFWSVMRDERVEGKIMEELTGVLRETRGDDVARWKEEPVSFEEAEKLVYMKAALAETLRLYPSVPMDFKYAVEDDVLPDGTRVPAGSTVTYSIYAAGRMKGVWGEDAEEFRPERWLSGDGRRFEGPGDGYRFLAFNGGPRTCLGKELAYLQMKSVAAAVLIRYRMAVAPGHRVEQKMSLTLFMKYGLKVYLEPRKL